MALGIEVKLDGALQAGDKFHITSNGSGIGDARNMLDLVGLQLPIGIEVASRMYLQGGLRYRLQPPID